jgi:hypothetical protein
VRIVNTSRLLAIAMIACAAWATHAPATSAAESETYAVFDTLFLQRDNASTATPFIVDGDTGAPVINADELRVAVAPGIRTFYGKHGCDRVGWELGYVGVYGMFAEQAATGSGNLEIAPNLSSQIAGFTNGSLARVSYGSVLNSGEANLLLTSTFKHHPRRSAYAAEWIRHEATIDWLAGFRWAGLEENAAILVAATPAGGGATQYGVRTSSNLYGAQLGVRGRMEWQRWALEGWMKAAVAGAALSQSQNPLIDGISGFQYRPARGAAGSDVGGIFDLSATVTRRLNDTWGLRAGYSMLWLTGVALAPDQFDFSTGADAGTSLVADKTIWLQGASLGLEARW